MDKQDIINKSKALVIIGKHSITNDGGREFIHSSIDLLEEISESHFDIIDECDILKKERAELKKENKQLRELPKKLRKWINKNDFTIADGWVKSDVVYSPRLLKKLDKLEKSIPNNPDKSTDPPIHSVLYDMGIGRIRYSPDI